MIKPPHIDPLLKTSELAQVYGRSMRTITTWRHIINKPSKGWGWGSNLPECPFKNYPKPKSRKFIPSEIVPKEVWFNNPAWWYEMYTVRGYGSGEIATMINRYYIKTRFYLLKYGIKLRTHHEATRSKNPYCNPEWLEEMYIINQYTMEKIAEIAGVTDHAIYYWLVNFGFPIRDINEAGQIQAIKRYSHKT